jgi:uncharacterized delta-60 repeat protein
VWTNNSLFISSTAIYLDNSGATPAPLGYYNEDGDIGRVNVTAGVISSFANCVNSDITCPVLDVDIEVTLTAVTPGYTSTATLYKSTDQVNWVSVGAVSIAPGDPANTTVINTFTVEELQYTKCTFSTNTIGGIMTTEVEVNLTQIQEHANATPISYTEVLAGTVSSTNTYKYSGVITDGDPILTDRVYVGGNYDTYQGAGWPTGGTIESLLALNEGADIDTTFNTQTGFLITGQTYSEVQALTLLSDDRIATGGFFNTYKGANVSSGIAMLNTDGSLDTAFNQSIGVINPDNAASNKVLAIAEDSTTGIIYIGGSFKYWDQGTLGGSSSPYTVSPRMVALDSEDSATIAGFVSKFSPLPYPSTFNYISKIQVYNNKIYVCGHFSAYDGVTKYGMIRLNMNGDLDTSWGGTGCTPFGADGIVSEFQIYNTYIYIVGYFQGWNGTTNREMIARLNLSDGTLDTGWNPGTGFTGGFGPSTIAVDSTGIYVAGRFTAYNGTTRNKIVKINHDATINTTFLPTTGFVLTSGNANVFDLKLDPNNEFIYATGEFDTYKGTITKDIVKINATNADLEDVPFNVGTGLSTAIGLCLLYEDRTPLPTTFPLGLCLGENPCDAYCCIGSELVYYGNAISLFASTILYADSQGTLPASAGWYSDGTTIVLVDALGNIVAYGDPESCNCGGPILYEYYVLYDPTIPCNACCGDLIISVYSTSSTWSTSTILYSDPLGNTPVLDGHYGYSGIVCNVTGGEGLVDTLSLCDPCLPCPSQECAVFQIMNTDNMQIYYSYTSCDQVYYSGTLEPGEIMLTACLQISNFYITGSYGIISQAIC